MKKLYCIKIFLVILLMTSVKVFAHKQELHQHITREAFNLLQMSFPEGLDEMEYFVGTDENSSGYPVLSWGDCRIVAGAWTEDEYDMVYHYGTWRRPNYNDVPPWVEDLLFGFQDPEDNRAAHTTITHFWDADNGEDAQTHLTDTIHGALGQSTWEFTISENAMKKIRKYISGDYDQRWIYTEPGLMWEGCTYIALANDFSIPSLIELFNCEGTVTAISYRSAIDGEWYWVSEPSWPASWLGKGFTCELFGRMCHLLQDMSVPAHVHCTSHAGTMGMYSDYFEENEMDYHNNYHTWTAQEIYDNGEMFIDPYVHEDPIYYLMYFMNQITDHYADGKVNGDDNYDSTIPGLSDIIPTLGAPTLTNEINDINCKAMYDVLIPYAIRVTAGLMYWFACETGQLNPEIYTLNSYFYKYTNPVSDEENKEISLYYITHNPFDPEVRVTIEKESGEIIWDNVEVALHSGVPREGYLPSWNFAKRLLLEDDYTGPITIQVSEDGVLTEETTVNYNPSNKPPLPILFPWPDGEKGIYPTRYGNYTSGLYYNRSYKLNINAPYSGDIDTWYNIKIEWDEEDGEHIFPLNYTSYVQFNDNGTVDLDIPPKSVIIGSGVTAGNVRLKINDVEGWDNYPVVFNTEAFSGLIRTVSYPGIIIYCIGAAPSPGCPTLYCGNERENNIIPLGENQEQDCFDYSLLKNTVKNSEVIEMKVTEDQDNSNYFDLVQLVAVGHSKDTEVGVNNSNGEIFLYNPKSQIRFDTGKDSSFVLQAEDSLLINLSDFNIPPVEYVYLKVTCSLLSNKVTANPNKEHFSIDEQVSKDTTENFIDVVGLHETEFTSYSEINENDIDLSNGILLIKPSRDIEISEISVVLDNSSKNEFEISNCNILKAISVRDNKNVLDYIRCDDNVYYEFGIDDGINLLFEKPGLNNKVVDYIFISKGRYIHNQSDEVGDLTYKLSNYPNPFSQQTSISFSIPSESKVNLTIYNIKGQLVKKFDIEGSRSSIVWNGKDENGKRVANGIYLYKLDVGDKSVTKKMILLR